MLYVKQFTFNMFEVHTYVVYDPDTLETAIIDPGMISGDEIKQLDDFIAINSLTVKHLINTHLHIDHALGDGYVRSRYGVPVKGHIDDGFLGENIPSQAAMFGLDMQAGEVSVEINLREGELVMIGSDSLKVIHVPGHSPGSIVLYSQSSHFLIGGDVIFKGSIGRTDLPGGNQRALLENINSKILSLPPQTVIFPGHGPITTVGEESTTNPFFGRPLKN